MRMENVKFTANAIYSNEKMKIRFFATEQAMSNWANA